mmetsp:Transcript_17668/g.27353  ORF Transcript_17668/g.27353 Transcript_17668/m.27353 type:complete len:184 (+) Transcript_17668:276-827(+)
MMVFLNCVDRHSIIVALVLMTILVLGTAEASYGLETILSGNAFAIFFNLIYVEAFFCMFIYIQKRIHKEVFVEVKKKNQLQEEFKTIFDELDTAIFIMKDYRITHVNLAFNWFLLQAFGADVMARVSQFTNAYELSEMEKENQREEKRKSKFRKCMEFTFCWRTNRTRHEGLSQYEEQQFLEV